MSTANVLGVIERKQNRFEEARAWFTRSLELAMRRDNAEAIGVARHNLGLVHVEEAETARASGDRSRALQQYEEARQAFAYALDSFSRLGHSPHVDVVRRNLQRLESSVGELLGHVTE